MKLACFSRYSLYVRHELAHVLFYDVFERDRVVIRQGDVGYSFYFIVSGSVLVEIQDKDPVSGIVRNNLVGELGAGATFGDLALLNDDKRRATIVCKEDCEFLKVDKTDFNRILMESCKDTWTRSNAILSQHPLFQDWNKESLKLAVEGSQFVEYNSNSVVIKNLSEQLDNVFIVTKGKCKVVQKVSLLMSKGASRKGGKLQSPQLILPPITTDRTSQKHTDLLKPCRTSAGHNGHSKRQRVKKWWVIRTLYPGDYFGLGEGPSDTCVICVDMAECLLINSTILAKQSQGRYLEEVRNKAKKLYPSIEVAFKSYVAEKEWMEYKQSVLKEVISNIKGQKRSL
jgi:CRP-like cAMP-binding protein